MKPITIFLGVVLIATGLIILQSSSEALTASMIYASDTFSRNVTDGWGTAESGGAYTYSGTIANFDVNGSAGTISNPTAKKFGALLGDVSALDVNITFRLQTNKVAAGAAQYAFFVARHLSNSNEYRGQIMFKSDNTVLLRALRIVSSKQTGLGMQTIVNGLKRRPNSYLWVHGQVVGANPTTIRIRVWPDGRVEPALWQYSVTDLTATLQQAGAVGLRSFIPKSTTNAPVVFSFDDYVVAAPDSGAATPTVTQTPTQTAPSTRTATPSPRPLSDDGFHYGVLDPEGVIGDSTGFAGWIASIRQYGMNDGFVFNDNPDLSVSDALGFHIITSPMYQMYRDWYYYEQYHNGQPLCGGMLTLQCAETQIGPIVDALKNHTSLVGYDTLDDANSSMKVRIGYANQVFRAHDTQHPEGPTLISNAYLDVYDYSRPDNFITYDYPAWQNYAACDFYHGTNQNWVDRLRFTAQLRPGTTPLWEILQAHSTKNLLRYPTVEEVRLNYWLALGEGTKGLYWFTWSDIPNESIGLHNNTTLLPEATDLVSRMNTLHSALAPLYKVADAFQVSNQAYISTLKNSSGELYVIVANQACTVQTLTLSSWSYGAQLQDLETGQIGTLPFALPFRGGDGRLFKVLNPTPLTLPAPQANLVQNGSFEQSSGGNWPDNWGTPLIGSGGQTGTVTWDSTVAHSGTHSMKFVGPANGGPYFSQSVPVQASKHYYLSYWVKGANLALNNDALGIRLDETALSCCNPFINAWWNQTGDFGWQKHVAFFRVPADYTQGRLDVVWNMQSGATAWLDDVTLCDTAQPCSDIYLAQVLRNQSRFQ